MKNANVRKPKTVRQGDQTASWSLLAPPTLDATPSKESATIQRKDQKQSDDEVPSAHKLGLSGTATTYQSSLIRMMNCPI
jgi:hypothetical protein